MKKRISSLNQFINNHLSIIIVIFILIQPVLDLLTSLEIHALHLGISIGSITRLLFLLFCIYYGLFVNEDKKYKITILGVIIYLILYALVIFKYKGQNIYFYEIRNGIDTFYLPITLISFYVMFKNKAINIKLNHIIIIYMVCLFFVLFPNLTHTGFMSYYHSKVGSVGWFYSANAIGNLFAFLLPFLLYYLIKTKINIVLKLFIILSTLYVFVSMGTKVPVLGFAICLFVNFIYYLSNSFTLVSSSTFSFSYPGLPNKANIFFL